MTPKTPIALPVKPAHRPLYRGTLRSALLAVGLTDSEIRYDKKPVLLNWTGEVENLLAMANARWKQRARELHEVNGGNQDELAVLNEAMAHIKRSVKVYKAQTVLKDYSTVDCSCGTRFKPRQSGQNACPKCNRRNRWLRWKRKAAAATTLILAFLISGCETGNQMTTSQTTPPLPTAMSRQSVLPSQSVTVNAAAPQATVIRRLELWSKDKDINWPIWTVQYQASPDIRNWTNIYSAKCGRLATNGQSICVSRCWTTNNAPMMFWRCYVK